MKCRPGEPATLHRSRHTGAEEGKKKLCELRLGEAWRSARTRHAIVFKLKVFLDSDRIASPKDIDRTFQKVARTSWERSGLPPEWPSEFPAHQH